MWGSGEVLYLEVPGKLSHLLQVYVPSANLTMIFIIIFFFNIYLFIYLFIYGCVGSSLLREGLLQLWQAGATPHRGARASHHRGLSCCGAQAPDAQAQ